MAFDRTERLWEAEIAIHHMLRILEKEFGNASRKFIQALGNLIGRQIIYAE